MKDIIDIVPATGLSQDYKNAVNALQGYYQMGKVDKVVELIEKHGIKKYEEHFPVSEYRDVVNDTNREGVEGLNRIVERIRTFTDPDNFPDSEFESLVKEFYSTISGNTTIVQ